ncbi:MAG TPA: phosphotransferase [Candidatus Saccharimonadales bacterium]|nr:phosphotransferase [Candidatus Saccharimonadales bacterium]
MSFDTQQVTKQLKDCYGLDNPVCRNLNTLVNYAIEVTSPTDHFALKIYNPASRIAAGVQWEVALTLHLIKNGAPVAKPVAGKNNSYLQDFVIDGRSHSTVLFEWAAGEKPKPELSTYVLLGKAAARIHNAADTFTSELLREKYDTHELIDDQLERMKAPLKESGQRKRVFDLTERMREIITNPNLNYGIIHNDLTLDNVHRNGDTLTVFDLDSAGESWRAVEPWGVLKASEERFKAWLEGYRSVREFSQDDEKAVAAFAIVEDIRNVVWKLGFAKSSRGKPLLQTADLPKVVDEWLEWEREKVNIR